MVEVDVDPDTGWVTVEQVWIAHDIGRALNPVLVEGQVEGSIYMALGEVADGGAGVPRRARPARAGRAQGPVDARVQEPDHARDAGDSTRIWSKRIDPEGPFGAKEVGQGPLLPVIPAVANAVYDAVGVRIDEMPITPEKVLRALELAPRASRRATGRRSIPTLSVSRGSIRVAARRGNPTGRRRREHRDAAPAAVSVPRAARRSTRPRALLAEHGPRAMVVAGGTDLYPNMKRRQQEPPVVIGLRAIAALGAIEPRRRRRSAHRRRRPRCTTWPPIRWCANATRRWRQAAGLVSTPHLRRMGTLGGNLCLDTRCTYYDQNYHWRKSIDFCMKKDGDICWVAPGSARCWAVSSSDTAPVAVALRARLTLVSAGAANAASRRAISSATTASTT